jgi:hypothetical protein
MNVLRGAWLWLFPATYLAHILEEGLAGERFYRWARRLIRRSITPDAFWALNAVFLAAMTGAILVLRAGHAAWLLPGLGTLIALNGMGHAVGSILARRYSPGTVSGLALWLPLGLAALVLSKPVLAAGSWWLGIAAGILASAVVALTGLAFGRRD